MKLAELFNYLTDATIETQESYDQLKSEAVAGVTSDSRQAKAGTVFVALGGSRTDGHQFLSNAASQGALALIIESDRKDNINLPANVPVISVKNTYKALAELSSALHGFPGKQL